MGSATMAAIGFLGGYPTAYVLERLGAMLRDKYQPFVLEPLPETLSDLAARLPARSA
jgi:hypothetical protein